MFQHRRSVNVMGISLKIYLVAIAWMCFSNVYGQGNTRKEDVESAIAEYFANYRSSDQDIIGTPRMESCSIDDKTKTIRIKANSAFATQEFTSKKVRKIYKRLSKQLPKPYNKYSVYIVANGLTIDELAYDARYTDIESPCMWGEIDYDGNPWVSNMTRPNTITHGLLGRHLSLWASHGRYYDSESGRWKWQRPYLFGTTEDLFTQTIVVPYLIPMLENAGANVFSPRERDYQTSEYIVDNDNPSNTNFGIINNEDAWETTTEKGFAYHSGSYSNGENPFRAGTAIMAKATTKDSKTSYVRYQPNFQKAGKYAIYVSYQTVKGSITNAEYFIYHKGIQTVMHVNQRMGGSTWVYLGTYEFDEGCNTSNCVVVSNYSNEKGYVSTDAVRFGGGMGNIERGGLVSGLPRCLEGARYSAQWSGAPSSVYNKKGGNDDYSDDINTRSLMTNWLGGGSVYMPSINGKGVPIELSLAIHSDAGRSKDGSIIGSLSICTTNFNDGKLNSGISRKISKDFADSLLTGVTRDLRLKYKRWTRRELYDRNYSETRLPEVPSAIIETLSHQNFADMRLGQDPNFKFTIARSLYKTILRFVNEQHGRPSVVQPLAPSNFQAVLTDNGQVKLSWIPTNDENEPTAVATSYNVYTAEGEQDFDNGQTVRTTSCSLNIEQGKLYSFKVTAVNRGGESFPTQVLSVYSASQNAKKILIVDNFDRLSSPTVIDTDSAQGFDINDDIGVERNMFTGWNGVQTQFNKKLSAGEGPNATGFGGNEMAGHFIMSNDFRHTKTHAMAMAEIGKYNVSSCSHDAIDNGFVSLADYNCVDIIFGLQKNDGHSLKYYKTFTTSMRNKLTDYMGKNGRLLVSGAYIGSDLQGDDEQSFAAQTLKLNYTNSVRDSIETIKGLGTEFDIYCSYNDVHYACPAVDAISPISPAYCAMQYSNGVSAAVAYDGTDCKSLTMGFPFECIKEQQQRKMIMSGILNFLLK